MKDKLVHRFIIGTFVSLYLLVSVISTIHVVDFFKLSNPYWLAVSLAIGFEIGAAASLASLIILDKMNKGLVWALFGTITLMQMQGNMYYAFVNMEDFQGWSELFGLIEEDVVYQKRALAAVSGAILPLVALGFIKSLVDYIKPREEKKSPIEESPEEKKESQSQEEAVLDSEEKNIPEISILEQMEEVSPSEILEEEKIETEVITESPSEFFEEELLLQQLQEKDQNLVQEEPISEELVQEEPVQEELVQEEEISEEVEVIAESPSEFFEEEILLQKLHGEDQNQTQEDLAPEEETTQEIHEEEVEVIPQLAEEEISAIMEEPTPEEPASKNVVSGYYGDILIDGNGIQVQENSVPPVNANKKNGIVDTSGKVYINPTRL